jgi:hypothetical protein
MHGRDHIVCDFDKSLSIKMIASIARHSCKQKLNHVGDNSVKQTNKETNKQTESTLRRCARTDQTEVRTERGLIEQLAYMKRNPNASVPVSEYNRRLKGGTKVPMMDAPSSRMRLASLVL